MTGHWWVVRIVMTRAEVITFSRLINALRDTKHVVVHRDDDTGACLDIVAPPGTALVDSKAWADEAADKWTDHKFNAVAAPAWRTS